MGEIVKCNLTDRDKKLKANLIKELKIQESNLKYTVKASRFLEGNHASRSTKWKTNHTFEIIMTTRAGGNPVPNSTINGLKHDTKMFFSGIFPDNDIVKITFDTKGVKIK